MNKSRASKYKMSLSESRDREQPYQSKIKNGLNDTFKTFRPKRIGRKDKFRAKQAAKHSLKLKYNTVNKGNKNLNMTRSSKSEDDRSRHSSISSS